MNKQSYLDSKQLQTECNECIKILNSELLEIEKVSNNIKLVLSETGLKGEAMEAYKKQLRRYFEIFALMKEADKFDIIDYSKLKADVELLLQYIPDGLPGVGIGMIQWSGSRRVGLLEYYRDNAIFYTEEELRRLEFEYMIAELSGDSSIAPENYTRIIRGCRGMSSEDAAAYIWANYEVSAYSSDEDDRRAIARSLEGIL